MLEQAWKVCVPELRAYSKLESEVGSFQEFENKTKAVYDAAFSAAEASLVLDAKESPQVKAHKLAEAFDAVV